MKSRFGTVKWLFFTWLIWGPIIINSQPGTTFFVFGIDWKADNLDNTMFWLGIILSLLGAGAEVYEDDKKKKEKRRKYEV